MARVGRGAWRAIARAVVSVVAIAILLAIVPLGAVLAALGRITIGTWIGCLAIFFTGHALNAFKVQWLVGRSLVPFGLCLRAQYAGLVANLGLPGLVGGDVVRGAYLVPSAGLSRVVAASVIDRAVDTLTLLALVAAAIPMAGIPAPLEAVLVRSGGWMVSIAAAVLVALAFVLRLKPHSRLAQAAARVWPALHERRVAVGAAVLVSVIVQSTFVLTNAWLAQQVGVTVTWSSWFVAWPLSKLVAVLPISLAGLGVREAALVSLLAPYGAPREGVFAAGLLWQGVLTVSGLAGLVLTHAHRRAAATRTSVYSTAEKL